MKGLSRDELRHLGRLARLELADEDLEHLEGELSRILEYVEQLAAVDVEGVEPLAQPIDLEPTTRPDRPEESTTRSPILSAAPQLEDGMYVVPPVIQSP